MRRKIALAAGLAAVGLSLPGCHSRNLTSSNDFNLVITAGIANSALQPTLLEAQLIFDNGVAVDNVSPAPTALLALNAAGGAIPGDHTMFFRVVNQTSSPNNYTVSAPDIQVYDNRGNFLRDMKLQTQSASVATGQGISYSFTL